MAKLLNIAKIIQDQVKATVVKEQHMYNWSASEKAGRWDKCKIMCGKVTITVFSTEIQGYSSSFSGKCGASVDCQNTRYSN